MHIRTPHLGKRREKRKASTSDPTTTEESVVIEEPTATEELAVPVDSTPAKKKITKLKPKKAKQDAKPKSTKRKAKSKTPEDPHLGPDSDLELGLEPEPAQDPEIFGTMHDTSTVQSEQSQTTTPRRSLRIKENMNTLGAKWHKMRPYVERINGTIMPLEHQGTKAYYARDGMKL